MNDVYVLAEHEQPTQVRAHGLLIKTGALEAMFPGRIKSFAETFDAYLVPDLQVCVIVGEENMCKALRALEGIGFEYGREMRAAEVELELMGRRAMHHLETDAGARSEQSLEAEVIDGRVRLRFRPTADEGSTVLNTTDSAHTKAPGTRE